MANHGLEAQIQIYTSGNRVPEGAVPEGRLPEGRWPVSVEEWRDRARAVLADGPWRYVEGGAGAEDTMRANREAFYRWRLRPRMLRNVEPRSLEIELFGRRLPAPILLAPVGVQSIVHPDAERAPARAAAAAGIPFVNSTVSSIPLEEVAACMGGAPKWFQLYPARNRDVMASMIERAQATGYEALVVTLDTTMLGWRERDLKHGYLPFLQAEGVANYFSDPAFRKLLPKPPEEDPQSAVLTFLAVYVNPAFTWEDLRFIRERTRVPLLLKGITHPDDAVRALDYGVDGIIVSNHGGRQVDGAVAALDALPEVCAAVGGRVPVLFDSGVRRAADVLKALALGARAVLIGRPYLYAMAVAGEAGVRMVIRNLMAELDLTLGLCGLASVADVDRGLVTEARA